MQVASSCCNSFRHTQKHGEHPDAAVTTNDCMRAKHAVQTSGVWVMCKVWGYLLASAAVGVDVEPRREGPLISEKLSV